MQIIDEATIFTSEHSLCQYIEAKESPCSVAVSMHGSLFNGWDITIKSSGAQVRIDPKSYALMYSPDAYRMQGGKLAVGGVVALILLFQVLNLGLVNELRKLTSARSPI
ncbi:hypothetical protein [Pseudomonas baetica]|uniref:hypothetical protein n=1 Tax=Pseudomonas baetica TaxID=674054 RepID=UPI0024076355|nr:hypothetical protein [Pseudomonas baetica]MDF9779091.1 hypothetical protein [Pseudomonas baetica]